MSDDDRFIPSFDDYVKKCCRPNDYQYLRQDAIIYDFLIMLISRYGVGRVGFVSTQIFALYIGKKFLKTPDSAD